MGIVAFPLHNFPRQYDQEAYVEQVACRTEEHEMSACGDTWEWDDLPTWMSLSQAWSQQVADMNPFVKLFPFNYSEMGEALLTVGMDLATNPARAQAAWMDLTMQQLEVMIQTSRQA